MEETDLVAAFESALVIPRSPTEREQLIAARQAQTAAPEAFTKREASRTAFAHLGASDARKDDARAFPALLNRRSGGAPVLPKGERIIRYAAPNVARLSISGGKRGVIESIGPMARRTHAGKLEPIDLGLKHAGSAFEPSSSGVAVQIPDHVRAGVRARTSGVTLTPTDAAGTALGGAEGSVQGASVVYANTQTDTDTLAKPTSIGFELSAILRSQDSPHALHYRLGLPHGAHLAQHRPDGPVEVVSAGAMLGMVMPPTAADAAGATVPVSMKLEGHQLSLQVQDKPGSFQYPLEVDPEYVTAEDRSLTGGVFPVEMYRGGTNWVPFHTGAFSEEQTYKKSYSCGSEWYWCNQSWYIEPNREYNPGEFAGLQYKTQGESTIYNLEMWVEGENEPSQTTTQVEYNYGPNGEGQDNHVVLSGGEVQGRYKYEPLSMTSGYWYNPLETPRNNDVRIMDYTTKHEYLYGFWTFIWAARVYVAQEESKRPEVTPTAACPQCGFNTSSPTIAGAGNRTNVLYGSGSWLSPYQGAYEVTAHDPGIGISYFALTGEGDGYHPKWIRNEEGKCAGIQCAETYSSPETYNSTMPDGEHGVEMFAEDAAGLYNLSYGEVKVDSKPPTSIGFTGMPEEGAEISAAPHTLTVHASDGTSPTPSSGVKSILVSLDGAQQTTLAASCSPGPCTASGQYSLSAEALSEGVHSLTITATDNAGNVGSAEEFLFDVRHASPVAVGPGSVDPTTGQLTLSASDVSLGGASGLERSYQSRSVSSPEGGPLGPQWGMSIGGGEGLRVLPNGDVVLISSTGGTTTFIVNKKGELEAPKGDETLKLEYKSSEHRYLLKDATAGSETVFEQPAATQSVAPNYGSSFGAQAGVLNHPVSDAIDPSGNVWVVDAGDNRIAKFTKTGAVLATYGSAGSEQSQYNGPWGIGIDPRNGNVYVTDQGNYRVEELSSSGAFIKMFGWGVRTGAAEYQICTSSCRPGIAGAGNGQFSTLAGVSVDSSGNVWVADFGNNRIQEFSEAGSFLKKFGAGGTGEGQFEGPTNIAFSGGSLFITDYRNNRVEKYSTAGALQGQFGEAGSENRKFSGPYGIASDPQTGNVYVVDSANHRVQEISASGSFSFVTKFGTSGAGPGQFTTPTGIAVDPTGNIFVVDWGANSVQEWTRATWWPTSAKGALPAHTTYAYAPVEGSEGLTAMEPSEVISPPPAGVSCGTKVEELKAGCRALTFKYATETTAAGENRSEWGDYKGHLSQVVFHAYNPTTKTMQEKAVAQYSYDKQGRLRAEWDPRISPALKTSYGYDAEGHVTSLTPPGQESWAFVYGTIAGDSNTGRALKVTRAPASASLWGGEAPKSTGAPEVSGAAVVGVRMAVSNGAWSGEPVVYGYQWEDCNAEGKACTPIVGANNPNYTVASSDVGHKLVAVVRAANGGGTVTAASEPVGAVQTSLPGTSLSYTQLVDSGYSVNKVACIPGTTDCVVSDSAGKALYATNVSASSSATWKTWAGPSGQSPSQALACPSTSLCLMADGKEAAGGKLYYATSLGGAWSEAYAPTYGVDAIACASSSFCVDGQDALGYFRYATSPASTSWILEEQGEAVMKAVFCLSSSFCAIADGAGSVRVATTTAQIESSAWTSTSVDAPLALNGIACTSTTACVAVDGAGGVINLAITGTGAATATRHAIDGTNSLSSVTCVAGSTCVAVDSAGNVFVSKDAGATWVKQYALADKLTSVSCSSASLCVTASSTGKVTAFNPSFSQSVDGGTSVNAVSCIPGTTDCVVSDSAGKALYATNVSASSSATWKTWAGPSGQSPSQALACPSTSLCVMSDGTNSGGGGSLYSATALGGAWTLRLTDTYGSLSLSCPSSGFCLSGSTAAWDRFSSSPTGAWGSQHQTPYVVGNDMRGSACLSSSFCVMASAKGELYVANTLAKIESPEWTATNIDTAALNGVACTSTTACVAVDSAGNVVNLVIAGTGSATATKHNIDGTNSLTAVTCTTSSTCVAVDNAGNVFISRNSGSSWTKEYALGDKLTSVSCSSASLCLAGDTTGNVIAFGPAGAVYEGEVRPAQPGATIEYRVPITGASAPYNMSKEELEKWGQKNKGAFENNDPVEATAVFPAGEPQGWPASAYKRATITYVNEKGLTVNTAAPTGGIATTEYNELNEVTRSLSPDDRATAMKEGCESKAKCKSAETAERLDTKTEYASEGQQIAKVTGPEHLVKLANGEEVQARLVKRNFYNEGAKAAEEKNKETYNLITKSTDAALLSNGKEEDKRETVSSYDGQEALGWKLRKPTAVTTDPSGLNLTGTTVYDKVTGAVVEAKTPGAAEATAEMTFKLKFGSYGSGAGQVENDEGLAVDPKTGNVFEADYELSRVEEFTASGAFVAWFGAETPGSGEGQLYHPESVAVSGAGNVYVGDAGNHRVVEFNSEAHYVRAFGTAGAGEGQFGNVLYGMAFDGNGKLWVADGSNHRVERFSETGGLERQYGEKGSGEGQLEEPRGIVAAGGKVDIVDAVNDRVVQLTLEGAFAGQFGKTGFEGGQLRQPWGIAADGKGDLFVADYWPELIAEFNAKGKFVAWIGSSGSNEDQFERPEGLALNPSTGALYVADEGNSRIDEWTPGNAAAHASRTIYYSTAANAEFKPCGERPEWAGLVCKTLPKGQPESKGPRLPEVTNAAYNIWDETEKSEESFGSVTRTKTETFDAAGRALTSEETASPATDQALPKTTVEYNKETGTVEKQMATIGGTSKAITTKYNKLDQLSEYTDAEGNVAKYTYEAGADGRLKEMTEGKGEEAASKQTYSYNGTSGLVETLADSAAGTFTAGYDVEGKMTSEIYPNGMCANAGYNPAGQIVSIQYIKTRNCAETSPTVWYSDTIVPSIHGEALSQSSTLAKDSYLYDNAGRLLQGKEEPTGKGCTTRVYGYDEESNRTSLVEREPASGGACAGEGSAGQQEVHTHSYDTANRLVDSGAEYETFGNATKFPGADAGGHELLSSFYVDGQVYTQQQNGETLTYLYDPAGRTMETASEGKTSAKVISHYAGPGEAPAWTSEGAGTWTRNVAGIDGSLVATQKNGEQAVLQLHDLAGSVIATASLSEAETKLLSTYNSTEFGVPQPGTTPPTHAWLGALGLASDPSMGAGVSTQGGASYVPQVARAVQTAPVVPPGAFPNGAPGTEYTATVSPGEYKFAEEEATRIWEQTEAERQRTKEREAAEQLQKCEEAGGCGLGPGESEDPTRFITRKEAGEVGVKLRNIGTWAELWDTVFAVVGFMVAGPEEFIEGEVASLIVGTEEPIEWYHKLGKKLIGCSENNEGFPYCKIRWKERHVEVPFLGKIAEWPDFAFIPRVQMCNTWYTGLGTFCLNIPHQ